MGRGKMLNSDEKAQIRVLKEGGESLRKIAERINRSKSVVFNYLRNMEEYGYSTKSRTKIATTSRERRNIIRIASNSSLSAAKIRDRSGTNASLSTVKRIISSEPTLVRRKLKKKPPLTTKRKQQRLEFSKDHITWGQEWHKVIFTDEKKFNLDGPDGYNYYYHDLRKEERFLSRHHSREGGLMVWGSISYYGTVKLAIIKGKMKGLSYKNLLINTFPDINNIFGPVRWIFQQDNAPIHTARIVKSWITEQNVDILPWPPYSPDLNIIENVWGWLTRKVYEDGRQFDNVDKLEKAIKQAWSEIHLDYLKSLYDSITNRLIDVIEAKGGSTKY